MLHINRRGSVSHHEFTVNCLCLILLYVYQCTWLCFHVCMCAFVYMIVVIYMYYHS